MTSRAELRIVLLSLVGAVIVGLVINAIAAFVFIVGFLMGAISILWVTQ